MDHRDRKLLLALDRAYCLSLTIGNIREDEEYHKLADDIVRLRRRLSIMQITRPAEAMPEQSPSPR